MKEGCEDVVASPRSEQGIHDVLPELVLGVGDVVREFVSLRVGPEELHGVGLRGVRRQVRELDRSVHAPESLLRGVMDSKVVPHDEELPAELPSQQAHEVRRREGVHVLLANEEEHVEGLALRRGSVGHRADDGVAITTIALHEDRGLADGSPRPTDDRLKHERALVYEDDGPSFAPCLFFALLT